MNELKYVKVISYNVSDTHGAKIQAYSSEMSSDAHSLKEDAAIHILTTEFMEDAMKEKEPSFTINEDTIKRSMLYIGYVTVDEDEENELRLIYGRPGIYPSSIENDGRTWTTIRLTPDSVLTVAIITPYDFLLVDYNKKLNKYVSMSDERCQKVIDHIKDSIHTNGNTVAFNAPSPLNLGKIIEGE